jgi:anthranilate synthase/aminodeoxychorismate synthase-like glutamine amidotransferase
MILLIDNYDSFVYNLQRYLARLGQEVVVLRNDAVSLNEIEAGGFEAIVLSPGPQSPDEAGVCLEIVRQFHQRIPMLGVCLGHQVIWQALGGAVVRAKNPRHGKTSLVRFSGSRVFQQVTNPFLAARYHSLVVDRQTTPPQLLITAWAEDDDEVMAFEHRRLPVFGLQFHPESVLTDCGYQLLANFLKAAQVRKPPQMLPTSDYAGRVSERWTDLERSTVEGEADPIAVIPGSAW